MKQISSLDLFFLTKEFKDFENSRIENFYFSDGVFYIKFYKKSLGNFFLTNKLSKWIFIKNSKEEELDYSNYPFISFLKKNFKNSFIEEIQNIENERILKLKISKKENNDKIKIYYIFIEIFSNGNIVLCDKELNIINLFFKKNFKDRILRVKEKYFFPPKKLFSIFNLEKQKIKNFLKTNENIIGSFVAKDFGVGGKFSDEILFLSNIEKNKKCYELKNEEIEKLLINIKKILEKKTNSFIIKNEKENLIIDFFPFKFENINLKEDEFFLQSNSFNDSLILYFEKFSKKIDIKEKIFLDEIKKLENRILILEKQKNTIERDYEKFNSFGNKIYENFDLIKNILEKKDFENSKIKKIDKKNNEIEIQID